MRTSETSSMPSDRRRRVGVLDDLDEPRRRRGPRARSRPARRARWTRSWPRRAAGAAMRATSAARPRGVTGSKSPLSDEHVVGVADRPLGGEHGVPGAELVALLDEDRRGRDVPRARRPPGPRRRRDRRRRRSSSGFAAAASWSTCHSAGRPQIGCRTLGVADFSRLPLPAARTTAASVRGGRAAMRDAYRPTRGRRATDVLRGLGQPRVQRSRDEGAPHAGRTPALAIALLGGSYG